MEKRTILAIALSLAVLLGFQYFFPAAPRQPIAEKQQAVAAKATEKPAAADKGENNDALSANSNSATTAPTPVAAAVPQGSGETIKVNNAVYRAEIDTLGGRLKSFSLKKYRTDIAKDSPDLNLVTGTTADSWPLSGAVKLKGVWYSDKNLLFTVESAEAKEIDVTAAGKSLKLKAQLPTGDTLIKEFIFQSESYLLEVEYALIDKAGVRQKIDAVRLNWDQTLPLKQKKSYVYNGVIGYIGEKLYKPSKKDKNVKRQELMGPVSWIGFTTKYFIGAIIVPDAAALPRTTAIIERPDTRHRLTGLQVNQASRVRVYIGPKKGIILQKIGVHLEKSIEYGWFGIIARPLVKMLHFFNLYVHNYGIAIIILTVLIKLVFYPLSQKSYKSMSKMKEVQPKLAKIKEKYKDDKARLNKEMMDLYRTHKVNPFGGCLPMLAQIPVFFALYRALMVAIELRHAPFFGWILDLSAKDPYYITPLIMGATMFLQQKMTPSTGDAMQAKMMLFMPIIFTFMFLNFPSGLVLYWLVNNLLSIGQQYMVMRQVSTS